MAENYIVMGAETDKIRGIAMYAESTENHVIERRKAELCNIIAAGLTEVGQSEPLIFIELES